MTLASSSSLFSGLPVRDLLREIKIENPSSDIQIALSLVFGTTQQSDQARKKSHLTHATEIEHQIRFVLKTRVERSIAKLASVCAEQLLKKSIADLSVSLHENDYISHTFFNHLKKHGLIISALGDIAESPKSLDLLTTTEINILNSIQSERKNLTLIVNYAREKVYVGDYSTAYYVLMQLDLAERTDCAHHILGLCCNFFENTTESEIHFRRLQASEDLLSKVKAAYVLSMLYLRLHPKEKQNLETAENFLEASYQLIEKNVTMLDYNFHSVFNRNGYALCLFRRGRIQEALDMLQSGIIKLKQSADGAKNLHQSVLLYNAAQCLKALKQYEKCEELCANLLEMDPLFPEYWLELTSVYLEQSKFETALFTLKEAENLDAFIPEIYALRGYTYLNQNKIELALANYKKAVCLAPQNPSYRSDLEYCFEMQNLNTSENLV